MWWVPLALTVLPAEPCDAPLVVVARAERLLLQGGGAYSLFDRNCEGFAYHAKTGRPWRSVQAELIPVWDDVWEPARLGTKLTHWFGKVLSTLAELVWVLVALFAHRDVW